MNTSPLCHRRRQISHTESCKCQGCVAKIQVTFTSNKLKADSMNLQAHSTTKDQRKSSYRRLSHFLNFCPSLRGFNTEPDAQFMPVMGLDIQPQAQGPRREVFIGVILIMPELMLRITEQKLFVTPLPIPIIPLPYLISELCSA